MKRKLLQVVCLTLVTQGCLATQAQSKQLLCNRKCAYTDFIAGTLLGSIITYFFMCQRSAQVNKRPIKIRERALMFADNPDNRTERVEPVKVIKKPEPKKQNGTDPSIYHTPKKIK